MSARSRGRIRSNACPPTDLVPTELGNVHCVPLLANVYNVAPASVYVRVTGAKSAIEKLKLTSDEVYLNLKGLPAGEHQVAVELSLQAGVHVVEQKPQRFRVRIIKPAE